MFQNRYSRGSLFVQPTRPKPPRQKWRVWHVIKTALRRTCIVLGAFMLFSAVMGTIISMMAVKDVQAPALPNEMVLALTLDEPLLEHADMLGPYGFGGDILTVRDVVNALDAAAVDKRVKGFAVKLEGGVLSLAHVEEVRKAVLRFRESGKFAYIFARSYEGLGAYYLASAFDEIWLQPVGIVSLPGINAELPFAREALDKIGVEPQVFARKDYKNFFESAIRSDMSPATREMMESIVVSLGDTIIGQSAAARGMEQAQLKKLVDRGLFTDAQALDAGLIDKLSYGDEFNEAIREKIKGDPDYDGELFALMQAYVRQPRSPVHGKKAKVALVYAVGTITQTDESGSLGGADTLVTAIREAAEADNVGAIVLRVDSPGGDPAAAEAIRRAVVEAKEKGKKIIVSMADSAASGGYWIAADADYIFALPVTFTGSIGVTGGKFSLREMWDKLGINWDRVTYGENAGLWSFNRPYSEGEAARMNDLMDNIYDRFITLVAEGRGMTKDEVDRIAGGRVWTGAQAKEVGLVDEVGGLDDALDYAAGTLGLPDRHSLQVIVVPKPKTPFEKILDFLEVQAAMGHFFSMHREDFSAISSMIDGFSSRAGGWVLAE